MTTHNGKPRRYPPLEFMWAHVHGIGELFSTLEQCRTRARCHGKKLRAVILSRGSTRHQAPINRAWWIRDEMALLGIPCTLKWFVGNETGKAIPQLFRDAIAYAKKWSAEHEDELVIIVTDCRNRYVRGGHPGDDSHRAWETEMPDSQRLFELAALAQATGEIPLCTILSPMASLSEVRTHERKISKPKWGTKRFREMNIHRAWDLREAGVSFRKIARKLGLPRRKESRIRKWIKMYRERQCALFLKPEPALA